MQVFKACIKVLKKELPVSATYILIFLALAFAFAVSGDPNTVMFEQTRLKICVFDEDASPESQSLVRYIRENHDVVDLKKDPDAILDALYYEKVQYVLTIRKGYAKNLASSRSTEALFENAHMHDGYADFLAAAFLDQYVSSVRAYVAGGRSLPDAIRAAETALAAHTEVTYKTFDQNPDFSEIVSFYFRYLPYILLSVMITTLCPLLLIMNRQDIRFRTNCSGIRPASYTLQLFMGSAAFILGVWLLFAGAGLILYGGLYRGDAWLAVLNSFLFTLVAAAWAIFLSCFALSSNVIALISQVVGLGMSFLCGIFVDMSLLGDSVLSIARFLPAYWYIRINNMITGTEPLIPSDVILFLLIEAAFAVVPALLTLLIRRLQYTGAQKMR